MTIIPILIKLFAINIVANSLLGLSNKVRILLSFSLSISRSSSRFFEEREKRDTSDPEIKADNIIKRIKQKNPKANPRVISSMLIKTNSLRNKGKGSSFKIYDLEW